MPEPNPQLNSPLVKLPREVRDAIYLDVWRLTGLRQHIVAHWGSSDEDAKPHYCRWKCCTPEFEVEDRLQEEIDQERIKKGFFIGEPFYHNPTTPRVDYQGFLSSPWDNHWECWLEITQKYGREYIEGNYGPGGNIVSTSGCCCWKDVAKDPINLTPLSGRGSWQPPTPKPPSRWERAMARVKRVKDAIRPPPVIPVIEPPWTGSPYMPMLLCCKLLSPEIVGSLYRSTTFIFTDIVAWQLWLGYCDPKTSPRPELGEAPRAFLENTRSIELGLHPVFKLQIPCTFSEENDDPEQLHDPYDFHWLKMDRFSNLRSVKIWMSARTLSMFPKPRMLQRMHYRLDQFSKSELIKALSAFDNLDEFIISTPLAQNIGPEDGYVQDVIEEPNHQVWKRGTGDHYHPLMDIDLGAGGGITTITTYPERMVTPITRGLSFSFSYRLTGIM